MLQWRLSVSPRSSGHALNSSQAHAVDLNRIWRLLLQCRLEKEPTIDRSLEAIIRRFLFVGRGKSLCSIQVAPVHSTLLRATEGSCASEEDEDRIDDE